MYEGGAFERVDIEDTHHAVLRDRRPRPAASPRTSPCGARPDAPDTTAGFRLLVTLPDGPERDRVRDEVLRAVLHLRFFEDWPQTRIAGRPGISQTHVSRPLGRTCARPRHETPCPRQQETGHGGSSTTSRSPAVVRTS